MFAEGVTKLDEHLRSTDGQKIVVAHSLGAQICARWMRRNTGNVSAPMDVLFILTGNPLRRGTGDAIGVKEIDGTIGVETPNGPWRIIDVARKNDGWAISSKRLMSFLGKFFTHPKYDDVNLFSPENIVTEDGAATFVTAP